MTGRKLAGEPIGIQSRYVRCVFIRTLCTTVLEGVKPGRQDFLAPLGRMSERREEGMRPGLTVGKLAHQEHVRKGISSLGLIATR